MRLRGIAASKVAAELAGLRYYDGPKCACGSTVRYTANSRCCVCIRLAIKGQQQRNRSRTALLELQGGKCACCEQPATSLDHNHVSGRLRGMLCDTCNRTLGHAKDCANRLRALAAYVDAPNNERKPDSLATKT